MFAGNIGGPNFSAGLPASTRRAIPSEASPKDQFTPGETPISPGPPRFSAASKISSVFSKHALLKSARSAVLVLATAAMIGGAFAPAVHAAENPFPQQVVAAAQAQNEYGLSADTLQTIRQDPQLNAEFHSLPRDFTHKYAHLTPAQKSMMYKQLSGSTWGVSHKEAFIKGKAFGTDAFQVMTEKLDKAAHKGTLSSDEVSSLKSDIARLREMTPAQRHVIAEIIMLQRGQ